mmetsp:Transcript_14668/g.50392  ORF Transcript_14668/g.50392 Transcript_14668/m.50392 type:complete len:230 (+) Transcript_14668:1100-1789(+)
MQAAQLHHEHAGVVRLEPRLVVQPGEPVAGARVGRQQLVVLLEQLVERSHVQVRVLLEGEELPAYAPRLVHEVPRGLFPPARRVALHRALQRGQVALQQGDPLLHKVAHARLCGVHLGEEVHLAHGLAAEVDRGARRAGGDAAAEAHRRGAGALARLVQPPLVEHLQQALQAVVVDVVLLPPRAALAQQAPPELHRAPPPRRTPPTAGAPRLCCSRGGASGGSRERARE